MRAAMTRALPPCAGSKPGSEVLALRADVADFDSMSRALEEARLRFGAIDGVFHAAGVAGGGMIQFREAEAVLAS